MDKITRFDRGTVKVLQDQIAIAFAPIAEKYGLNVKFRASFRDTDVSFKLVVTPKNKPTGEVFDERREAFIEAAKATWPYVPMVQMRWLDQTFAYLGETFKVVGYMPRSRKRPILVADKNGKRYKMSIDMVKDAIDGPTFKDREVKA